MERIFKGKTPLKIEANITVNSIEEFVNPAMLFLLVTHNENKFVRLEAVSIIPIHDREEYITFVLSNRVAIRNIKKNKEFTICAIPTKYKQDLLNVRNSKCDDWVGNSVLTRFKPTISFYNSSFRMIANNYEFPWIELELYKSVTFRSNVLFIAKVIHISLIKLEYNEKWMEYNDYELIWKRIELIR